MSDVVLTANQYGKAENRVVRITRDTDRHEIEDLNVTSQLRGDFAAAHTDGDNAHVVATDTQKNTVFAFARDGVGSPEAFLLRLADHFTDDFDWVTGGRWAAEQYRWTRINDHDHSFYKSGPETRTAVLVRDGETDTMISGFYGLTVLKSTGSGFVGYPKDRYTTLPETTDRILATDIATRWRYNTTDLDYNAVYDDVRSIILAAFVAEYSKALQQTLYQMGEAVITAHPEIDEIKFSCPNKHHFLSDLSPFGLDNPGEVFYAADRPYGLIEATIAARRIRGSRPRLGRYRRLLLTPRPPEETSPMNRPRNDATAPARPEDEFLGVGRTFAYGAQHVLTMYGGIIAPPLIIGGAAGVTPAQLGLLVASCLFIGGLATLLQSVGVQWFGSQLPLVQGTSFASVATLTAIVTQGGGLPAVFGSVMASAAIGLLITPFFARIIRFFPPVVTGTVITTIGLSLMPVAANWAMGGNSKLPTTARWRTSGSRGSPARVSS